MKKTTEDFIKEVNKKWNNEYELIKDINYQGAAKPMSLIHIPCGQIRTLTRASNFLVNGCQYCSIHDPKKIQQQIKKRKQTNLERYGVEWALQNRDIQQKQRQTNLERYGVEYPIQNPEIKEKTKQTNLKRYGVENVFQSSGIKEKIKQTNLERYGVENVFQSSEIKEKIKQTNLEKYGVSSPIQNQIIKEQTEQTNLKRYGFKNPMQNQIISQKSLNSKREKLTPKELKFRNKESLSEAILDLTKELGHKPTIDDIVKASGLSLTHLYNYYDLASHSDLYKKMNKESKAETEIAEFLCQYTIIERHNRKMLDGREIDIYLPEYKVGVEYNGVYWHNSSLIVNQRKPKSFNYHLNKRKLANSKGIHLIQIFENDYIFSSELIKQKLLYFSGINLTGYNIDFSEKEIMADLCWSSPWTTLYNENGYIFVCELPPTCFYYNNKTKETSLNVPKLTPDIFCIYNAGWHKYVKG